MRITDRRLLGCAVALSALCAPAMADLPVIDAASLFKWVEQAQQMSQQITQLENTVHSLTNVPQNLIQQVEGLLQSGVRNPLGNITQNLQVLLGGQGTGTCNGSQNFLTQNQYAAGVGGDFTAQWLNQSATRNAGIQACTQQMLTATQTRLDQMPALLDELQGAQDVTQVAAVSARIQQEIATVSAQQQQAMLMAQMAATQHMMAEDQVLQKQRADAQEVINNTSASPNGVTPAPIPAPQPFTAPGT